MFLSNICTFYPAVHRGTEASGLSIVRIPLDLV